VKIGLLFEREIDLMSAIAASAETHYHWREQEEVEAIATALTQMGHEVDQIAPLDQLLERWRQHQLPDFIWNLSVRAQSRSRTALAPALLEQLDLPYTGADAAVKSLTLNKDWLKPLLQWCNVLTPPWQRYDSASAIATLPPWFTSDATFGSISILKPACEGYSLGLTRWTHDRSLAELQFQVGQLLAQFHAPILCEPLISGREITVGVVGNRYPQLIGAVETVTQAGQPMGEQILDLQAKRQGEFKKVAIAASDPLLCQLQSVVQRLLPLLSPIDYATFDFRVAADQLYLLDINTDATLHPQRSLAQIARVAGISYAQLIALILQTSMERWQLS
jgi:D-alanine-D-alanine ligase